MGAFKNNLINIAYHVSKVQNKDVMKKCISERLDSSLNNYYKNILDTCEFLVNKSPLRMIKIITREFKEGDSGE